MPATDLLIGRVSSLTRSYGAAPVLDGVSFDIHDDEVIALIGRSGSGKSTLLRSLAGLDHAAAGTGEVLVPSRVSFAFQDSRLLPWKTVLDNVTLGLEGPEARARGRRLLAEVGLGDRARAWPHQLSGGEQQRAALARALAGEPELLLMDEPFGALDALTRRRMHQLLLRLRTVHRPAIVLVTHDVEEAVLLADRVLVLHEGRIAHDLAVRAPRPRRTDDPPLLALRRELLTHLGVPDAPTERTAP